MNDGQPPNDPSLNDHEQTAEQGHKSRSIKHFLLTTTARVGIGLGIVGGIALIAWLARNQLATTTLEGFLNSKGIASDISIEKLQFDTAHIRNIRLGPADAPDLVVKKATIKWRIDSKARLFVVEGLQIDHAELNLAMSQDGKLDWGSLKSLMDPSFGPKRSMINGVMLSDANVTLATPQGPVRAKLSAWGGETAGWTGRADITLPKSIIATDATGAHLDIPLRVGFSLRTPTPDRPTTLLGFSVVPSGQNLAFEGTKVWGLVGKVTGLATLGPSTHVRIDTRPSQLRAQRIETAGGGAQSINVDLGPIFWNQSRSWATTGWGNLSATGTIAQFSLPNPTLAAGSTRFQISGARGESGRVQIDYLTDLSRLSGTVGGQRLRLSGNVSTTLRDIRQVATSDLAGTGKIEAFGLLLPPQLKAALSSNLPQAITIAAQGLLSGSGTFDFKTGQTGSQISLAGPLAVSASNGARAQWTHDAARPPTVVMRTLTNGDTAISALGSGLLDVDIPKLMRATATLDAMTYSAAGWAMIGRNIVVRPSPDFSASNTVVSTARFDRLEINAPTGRALTGRGSGQIEATAPSGRARIDFALSGTPALITASLAGPIDGFGQALGLGGYGARRGQLKLVGRATGGQSGWQFNGNGTLDAASLDTQAITLSAPRIGVTADGQILDLSKQTPRINAQIGLQGAARDARGIDQSLRGISFEGRANLTGNINRMNIGGRVTGSASSATLAGTTIEQSATELSFGGVLSGGGVQLSGTNATTLARLVTQSTDSAGRVEISRLAASGPFTLQSGRTQARQDNGAMFWNGLLKLANNSAQSAVTANIVARLDDLQSGATRLTDFSLVAPLQASNTLAGQWRGRLEADGKVGQFVSGDTRIADLSVKGPISFAATLSDWQAQTQVVTRASLLVSGDTRLTGLTTKGPLDIASSDQGQVRITSRQCLDFSATGGSFPGEASVGPARGKICPDARGQLAIIGGPSPRLFATTQLDPLTVSMGGEKGNQSIDIGEVSGAFSTSESGNTRFVLLASQFGLNLKMPDGTTASVKSIDAELDIEPQRQGTRVKGRLGKISSTGLPVSLSGGASADISVGPRGLNGLFNFDDISLTDVDASPRFGKAKLVGGGTLTGNQVSIISDIFEPSANLKIGDMSFEHNIETGGGSLDVRVNDLLMSPTPVQGRAGHDIVTLLPSLRGVVLDMKGVIDGSANFVWSREHPIVSRAHVATKGLDFETLLGPVSALAGDVSFDDVLLARTAGTQTIKIGELNTGGIPIIDGTVQFTLPGDNSLRLEDASWPFADGKLSVRPATWEFRDGDQAFAIDVDDVDLAKLLRLTEVPNLEIDGKVSGVFPIEVRNGNIEIVGGRLKAREEGGMIRYTGPGASPPPPPPGFFGKIRERLFGKPPPAGADLAVEALRALEYRILEIAVDGRLSGELQLGIILQGANQQVLSGQPFKFNINMNVPVGQLLDNLNRFNNTGTSPEVLKELDRIMRDDAADAAPSDTAPLPAPPVAPSLPPPLALAP
jgi:hypothetical protein